MPKAYIVVEHTITDATKFEEYRIKVGPMIAKHGERKALRLALAARQRHERVRYRTPRDRE